MFSKILKSSVSFLFIEREQYANQPYSETFVTYKIIILHIRVFLIYRQMPFHLTYYESCNTIIYYLTGRSKCHTVNTCAHCVCVRNAYGLIRHLWLWREPNDFLRSNSNKMIFTVQHNTRTAFQKLIILIRPNQQVIYGIYACYWYILINQSRIVLAEQEIIMQD